jgi:hypothetical protein
MSENWRARQILDAETLERIRAFETLVQRKKDA